MAGTSLQLCALAECAIQKFSEHFPVDDIVQLLQRIPKTTRFQAVALIKNQAVSLLYAPSHVKQRSYLVREQVDIIADSLTGPGFALIQHKNGSDRYSQSSASLRYLA